MDKSLIDEISKKADIVQVISYYIKVIRKGKAYVAICPFHDDTHPSLQISPEYNTYHCFVCNSSGNAFTFVSKYEHISFIESVKKVAEIIGFHDDRLNETYKPSINPVLNNFYNIMSDLNSYYEYSLKSSDGKIALDYFHDRGLNDDLIKYYHLGFSPINGKNTISFLMKKGYEAKLIEDAGISPNKGDKSYDQNQGRAIFPLFNENNQVIGFSARTLNKDETPKYINSKESKIFSKADTLYNFNNSKNIAKNQKSLYILEGFMDVFALHKIGYDNTVALMGTALTKDHVLKLKRLNSTIILCLDGDQAGQQATMKSLNILMKEGIETKIVDSTHNLKDPDEILKEDGEVALKEYLSHTLNAFDFVINYYSIHKTLKNGQDKEKLIRIFSPWLKSIKSEIEFDSNVEKLSKLTEYSESVLKKYIDNYVNNKSNQNLSDIDEDRVISSFHPERAELRKLQYAESEVLYHMLNSEDARKFYEEEIKYFYIDIYRDIANYILEESYQNKDFNINSLITLLEYKNQKNKDQLIETINSIVKGESHVKYSEKLMRDYKSTIDKEKRRINEKENLIKSTIGKSDEEKAKIIKEKLLLKNL